jgi:hypothetical protein
MGQQAYLRLPAFSTGDPALTSVPGADFTWPCWCVSNLSSLWASPLQLPEFDLRATGSLAGDCSSWEAQRTRLWETDRALGKHTDLTKGGGTVVLGKVTELTKGEDTIV